jgi:hypothetical protein
MDAHRCEAENPAALRDSLKPVRSQRPDYPFAANAVTAVGCVTLLHCAERGHAVLGAEWPDRSRNAPTHATARDPTPVSRAV